MRTSAWGSVLAWGITALVRFVLELRLISWLAFAVACAFSLLFLAHLVTYAVRSGIAVRRHWKVVQTNDGVDVYDPSRRDFLRVMAMAAGYALAISFLGTIPGRAQLPNCPGTDAPHDSATGTGATAQAAKTSYENDALRACDNFCSQRFCGSGKACFQSDDKDKKPKKEDKDPAKAGSEFQVTGKVKQCTCKCESCAGEHRPPDTSHGKTPNDGTNASAQGQPDQQGAINGISADGAAKCEALCARFTNCGPKTCKKVTALLENPPKTWQDEHTGLWSGTAKILKCSCGCQ
jgi:hypothetical protein